VTSGFFARLEERVADVGSLVCIGLDPRAGSAREARDQAVALIAATAQHVAAFKPNSAFFEAFGADGFEALREVIAAVPEEVPVLLDAKRGDIASTAEAYATAAFEQLGADAITLSPYLGAESIDPFLAHEDRGVFILCRTSNPGGAELQETPLGSGEPLYLAIARAISGLPPERAGLVVGATEPEALALVREVAPEHWILAPGVGAQGGSLDAAVAAGVRADGSGLLIPISRSVASADDPGAYVVEINEAIATARSVTRPVRRDRLAGDLFTAGCVRFGDFELKSGVRSPVYLDLRNLVGHPDVLRRVARRYISRLAAIGSLPALIAGVPLAGLPIATAVGIESGVPMIYPRPEQKRHGTGAMVEGPYEAGQEVVVVDDVATSGTSILEAAATLREAGLIVNNALVLVDRGGAADVALAEAGIALRSVTTLAAIVDTLASDGAISEAEAAAVHDFLAS
jgi:uridine monophosphate synthetase